MRIVFQDKDVVVVEKEHGELSQSDKDGNKSLVELLSLETGSEIYPVHRLDRPVGGIMVYAKNKKAASSLSAQLLSDGIGFAKEYEAIVSGILPEKQGVFTDLMYKDGQKNKSFVCKSERKGVKRAELEYQVLSEHQEGELSSEPYSVVRVKLRTGRTHQIRVQFSSRGFPILGDGKYGSRVKVPFGIALRSVRLGFIHPTKGERMEFFL